MKKINEIETTSHQSPKGAYELKRQHISLALGGRKDRGVWDGGHPFDIERSILPPGKKNFPYHSHAAQWEHYIFVSGSGRFLDGEKIWHPVNAGDHIICPPGEAHLLENDSASELVYYVIADHHPAEITSYPNTGKRHLKPEMRVIEATDVDYYQNEE